MSQENVEVVRQLLEGPWKRPQVEPVDYIDWGGPLVLFVARMMNTKVDPPKPINLLWFLFRVEEGKVVKWDPYTTEEAAREAVRLSEQDAHADS